MSSGTEGKSESPAAATSDSPTESPEKKESEETGSVGSEPVKKRLLETDGPGSNAGSGNEDSADPDKRYRQTHSSPVQLV